MKSPNPKHVFAAMLGACLFACNPPSEGVDAAQDPGARPEAEFDRSALAIKATRSSQQEKTAAMEALASRYGHIAAPRTVPHSDPAFRETEESGAGALGKTALVNRWYQTKVYGFGNEFALMIVRTVKANQALVASTTRPAGSTADPFIVATYATEVSGVGDKRLVKVVGLNDDNAGLDSRISWKNLTGSDKTIQIVAFPYSPGLSGTTTLTSTVNGGSTQSVTDLMEGSAVYDNNLTTTPIAGCTGPNSERLMLRTDGLGNFTYGAMMVNAQNMTGALIYNGGLLTEQTIGLPSPTPNGYPNFLLVFATSKNLGGGPQGIGWGYQEQKFSCAN